MRTLDPLFSPRSIAVVGASAAPAKAGNALLAALGAFPGGLYPINPREDQILGRTAYPRLTDVPDQIDLALLVVPPPAVPAVLRDAADAGVKAVVIHAGGFAESGTEGGAIQAEIEAIVAETGLRLLGPNTSGFINPVDEVRACFMPAVAELPAGSVSIVAQSGGVNIALAFLCRDEGVGIRLAVGLGNAVDVGFVDVLDHLAGDPETRAIGIHVEGLADGRAVIEAIERVTESVPVVALKIGRADVGAFAQSHTGALTGDFALARSALAQAGAVVVDTPTELVDAVHALSQGRMAPAADPGIAVVTGQAGPGLIIADALRTAGVSVPELQSATVAHLGTLLAPITYQRNPVDTGRPEATFAEVVATVAADDVVDGLIAYGLVEASFDPVAALGPSPVPSVYVTEGARADLAVLRPALESAGVPVYLSPERGAFGVAARVVDARARLRRSQSDERSEPVGVPVAPLGPAPLDEDQAKSFFEAHGVVMLARRACATRSEAAAALAALGGPVVVKILDAEVLHKSDVGGVHVGVRDQAGLDAALDAIDAIRPGRPVRYLVEAMAAPGAELIVGGVRDAVFGPVVLLGVGGVLVEAVDEAVLGLAPLGRADAADMVAQFPVPRILDGYRGQPAVDRAALADLLVTVGRVLVDHPEIAEVDLNPVRGTADGLVALDALIQLG